MKRVVVESPYAGVGNEVQVHVTYARACIKDCLERGEAPIASHLLYTQPGVLDDKIKEQRAVGMAAGFEWGAMAEEVVVYTDHGISDGMRRGMNIYGELHIPITLRSLYNGSIDDSTAEC